MHGPAPDTAPDNLRFLHRQILRLLQSRLWQQCWELSSACRRDLLMRDVKPPLACVTDSQRTCRTRLARDVNLCDPENDNATTCQLLEL